MKFLPLIILLFCVSGFAQTTERAVVTYSVNYKLIGLSNLLGLSDCSVKSLTGRVRKLEKKADTATVSLKIDKKTTSEVIIPLGRVPEEHRDDVFDHLITKNNTIRVSGYACTEDAPFSAFSVDRVY